MDRTTTKDFSNLGLVDRKTLPPELIDLVISHLSGNYRSLKACAQVSHVFRDAARLHLLSIVILSNATSLQRFIKMVNIDSKPEAILSLVRKLVLKDGKSDSWMESAHGLLSTAIDLLITHGTILNAVHITTESAAAGTGFKWSSVEPIEDKLGELFSLKSITSVRMDTRGTLPMTFFKLTKKLTSLALDATAATLEDCMAAPLSEDDRPDLTSLHLMLPSRARNADELSRAIEWLIAPEAPFSLAGIRKLAINSPNTTWSPGRGRHEVASVNRILRACEDTLEELLFIPSYSILHCIEGQSTQFIALRNFPLLRSLIVVLPIEQNFDEFANIFFWAGKLVSSINQTTPKLRRIRICVDLAIYADKLNSGLVSGWSLLDAEIASARPLIARLERVEIVLVFGSWETTDRNSYLRKVRNEMHRLTKRRLLDVRQADEPDYVAETWRSFS